MEDCLFCKIINKEIPSKIIYEDNKILVFLDINPTTNGDTLIVPKNHYKDFLEIDDDINNHIKNIIPTLYSKYKEKLKCDGLTLSTNIDYGQDIHHYHIHFIPRYINDEVSHSSNKDILENLDNIYNKLNK